MSIRPVKMQSEARPTTEGAGVHLHRVFGFGDTTPFDPFLMMDDFRNDDPAKYLNGFPWHPHRGIETITYVLKGNVEKISEITDKEGFYIYWLRSTNFINISKFYMTAKFFNARLGVFKQMTNTRQDLITPNKFDFNNIKYIVFIIYPEL